MGLKRLAVFSLIAAVGAVFVSCEMPETRDELDRPMPAVWAIFSPDELPQVYLTRVVPFGGEFPPDSAFVHDAQITLSWSSGAVEFVERDTMTDWGVRWLYVPTDTTFRVQPGETYTLSGITEVGNFSGQFTVPVVPDFQIYPDTAVFDNVVPAAFAVVVNRDPTAYEYEVDFENIGTSREFLPDSIIMSDCYDLRWLNPDLPDTVVVPWCKFYYATTYEVQVIARDINVYRFIDYYYHLSDDEEIYTTPGGDGYVGVIGAYCIGRDTVAVVLGD